MKKIIGLAFTAALAINATQALAQDKKQLAFVVNAASDFWKLAEAGVKKAQGELPELRAAVQVSGARHRRAAERADGRPCRRRHQRHHDLLGRSEDLDRRLQPIAAQVPLFTTD